MVKDTKSKAFFGITTIGEKGQIVIPAQARDTLGLARGDKLLVFGKDKILALSKLSDLQKLATNLGRHLDFIQHIIDKGTSPNK